MKNGFRVMDSDLHTMEPDGLWERYLDEPFKRFAPKFIRGTDHAPNQPIIKIGALDIGEMSKRPRTAVVGKDLQRRAFARSPHYEVAHARGYDAASHVQAMDIEGIDVAILYGTPGRQVLMHDDLEPQVTLALARAHNSWTHDYCEYDATRLRFAAQVAFHDVTCGWLPWYLWRLDEAWEKFGPGSEVQISQLPSQYSSGSASSRPTPTRSRSAR